MIAVAFILGQQQLQRETGVGEPAGGVDPRRELEADRLRRYVLRLHARDLHQRPQTGPLRLRQRLEAATDDLAVLAQQRHHVGDCCREPPARRARLVEVAAEASSCSASASRKAMPPVAVLGVRDARSGSFGLTSALALRQLRRRDVVIDDDDFDAELERACSISLTEVVPQSQVTSTSTPRRRASRWRGVEAVALALAVGDVGQRLAAEVANRLRQDGRRGDPVDVEVAVDADEALVRDSVAEHVEGGSEAGQREGSLRSVGLPPRKSCASALEPTPRFSST